LKITGPDSSGFVASEKKLIEVQKGRTCTWVGLRELEPWQVGCMGVFILFLGQVGKQLETAF
jgi:hypothetical protein